MVVNNFFDESTGRRVDAMAGFRGDKDWRHELSRPAADRASRGQARAAPERPLLADTVEKVAGEYFLAIFTHLSFFSRGMQSLYCVGRPEYARMLLSEIGPGVFQHWVMGGSSSLESR
jgi:hypothetical protein